MTCPKCKGIVRVIDKVDVESTNEIYRRRKCTACGHDFFTVEFEVERDETFMKLWTDYNRSNSKNRKK